MNVAEGTESMLAGVAPSATSTKDVQPGATCTVDGCCNAAVDSVIDLVEADSATVVIIGGGPHALAALSALHEGSLAFQQHIGEEQWKMGFESYKKIGSVCVIDPGARFNESWDRRFEALDIKHLRSPAVTHPAAYEPQALLNFALREGRTDELVDQQAAHKWLVTTDMSNHDPLLKALPSTALFRDFCASLAAKLPHRWLSGTASRVCKDEATGKLRVCYSAAAGQAERQVVARAVILATGPASRWNVPKPFAPCLGSRRVLHTEALLTEAGTLREAIARRCPGESARVLVIGGGISAAQAALAAFHAGARVVLRSRRPLHTRAFDIAPEWLDARHTNRLRFDFLATPIEGRRRAIREAQTGGSVPKNYMEELLRLARASDAMVLEVDEAIDRCRVSDEGGELRIDGEPFAMAILATGVATSPDASPLFQHTAKAFGAPTVDGLPHVDSELRWAEDEDIFVMGANAGLELGPGGGNLMGAMRGAKAVSDALHGLMWERADGRPARSIVSNQYDALRLGDEDDGDEEDDDESEGEEPPRAAQAGPSEGARPDQRKAKKPAGKPRRAGRRRGARRF